MCVRLKNDKVRHYIVSYINSLSVQKAAVDLLPEAPSWGPWIEEGEVNHTKSQVTSTSYIHFLVKKRWQLCTLSWSSWAVKICQLHLKCNLSEFGLQWSFLKLLPQMSETDKPAGGYCCFERGTIGYLDREREKEGRARGERQSESKRKSITQILWDNFWHCI